MYIESFEEILRKILRYRNDEISNAGKIRTQGDFRYDHNDFIVILYEETIEDYAKTRKQKGKLCLKTVKTLGFWCFNAGNSFR